MLLEVKGHLLHVSEKHEEVRLSRDMAVTTLELLRHQDGVPPKEFDKLTKQLAGGWSVWEDAQKQSTITKASIQPLVKIHGHSTKTEIQAYEDRVTGYAKAVDKLPIWQYQTGVKKALEGIEEAIKRHREESRETDRMSHLAVMFEFPSYMDASRLKMKTVKEELEALKSLWGVVKEVQDTFAGFNKTLFRSVDADKMEETAKRLHKSLRGNTSKKIRDSDAFRGVDQDIKNFLNTCPLIMALTHKCMRPRHWEMLMKTTGVEFTPPHKDKNMELGALLELNLHTHTAEVEEITDQALKEEKMESALKRLDEVWANVNFVSSPYKEGSDIQLLAIAEEDYDMLENDQLTVQGMMASRFLATFEVEVTSWQKALSMVAEVLTILNDIQRTWSYLEPLFVGSEEVKKELPETAEKFAGIDLDVKGILSEALATKNIRSACNRAGLLEELERLSTMLEECKKALADYLDGKRRIFPRFYFVSEADLLDILSNGNTPSRIVHHITKVLLATATLDLDESKGGRPYARKFISSVGVEEVELSPPVHLDGKVEIYLQVRGVGCAVGWDVARDVARDVVYRCMVVPTPPRPI